MNFEDSWRKLLDLLSNVRQSEKFYEAIGHSLPSHVRDLILHDDQRGSEQSYMALVHYTSWQELLQMLQVNDGQSMFRMYNYEMVNDPQEGGIGPAEWRDIEGEVEDLLQKYAPDGKEERARRGGAYGCSFSTSIENVDGIEDDLMFWRLYGDNGKGVSLKLGAIPKEMYRVRYREYKGQGIGTTEEEDRDVTKRMCQLLDAGKKTIDKAPDRWKAETGRSIAWALAQVLDGYLYLVKNKAYEHEQEWRAIKIWPNSESVKYEIDQDGIVRRYVNWCEMKELFGSASVITLGPKVPNGGAARAYIEKLARTRGMEHTTVRISKRNYR